MLCVKYLARIRAVLKVRSHVTKELRRFSIYLVDAQNQTSVDEEIEMIRKKGEIKKVKKKK